MNQQRMDEIANMALTYIKDLNDGADPPDGLYIPHSPLATLKNLLAGREVLQLGREIVKGIPKLANDIGITEEEARELTKCLLYGIVDDLFGEHPENTPRHDQRQSPWSEAGYNGGQFRC